MPIYTRTGDKGETSLFDGTRVAKNHPRVESYATVDELNSQLGAALAFIAPAKHKQIAKELEQVQHDLFAIGSALALPHPLPVTSIVGRTAVFEKEIDKLTKAMPELKNFILPGGSKAGSLLHVARTGARRAERSIVALMAQEELDDEIVKYINRLSDLLYTYARYINYQEKKFEIIWKKK